VGNLGSKHLLLRTSLISISSRFFQRLSIFLPFLCLTTPSGKEPLTYKKANLEAVNARLFSDITAFGKERWGVINHNEIIVFLRGVYDRWIEKIQNTGEIK
jgi:hypothetical protein